MEIHSTVSVGSLGGTITMVEQRGGGTPRLGADQLVSGLGGLGMAVRPTTLERLPGASLTPQQVVSAVQWSSQELEGGADGVVLVQGTDTLAESAYLASLYWRRSSPLVFTGAMRLASDLSADGPANVRDACVAASSRAVAELGVTVCINGELHRPDRVEKTHSWSLGAFSSGSAGVVGAVREGEAHVWGIGPGTRDALRWPASDPRVGLLSTYLGDDGSTVERIAGDGLEGLIVEGFGAGHVPARVAAALERIAPLLPVVVCSAPTDGGTLRQTYGFPGSELDLQEKGVHMGGTLSPRKARLLLWGWLAQPDRATAPPLQDLLARADRRSVRTRRPSA